MGILFGHIIDYNKKLVEKIYEERIQEKTIAILVKTFLECLEHFRGNKFYKELEGLEKEYQNVIKSFRDINLENIFKFFKIWLIDLKIIMKIKNQEIILKIMKMKMRFKIYLLTNLYYNISLLSNLYYYFIYYLVFIYLNIMIQKKIIKIIFF